MSVTPFFLVALPKMDDAYFERTLVLITRHGAEGSEGLILNKPLMDEGDAPTLMKAEIKDLDGNVVMEFSEDLFDGGPVQDESVFALHDLEGVSDAETRVHDGLFLSGNPDDFQRLLEFGDQGNKRFFLGLSGWGPGQIDAEIRNGAWMHLPFNKSFLFRIVDGDRAQFQEESWKAYLRGQGLDPLTLISQGPNDGGFN